MAKKKLCLIVGRGSCGKSTLVRLAAGKLGLRVVKSYTTRPPRNDREKLGDADHYFISREEAKKYHDQMLAYTRINGNDFFTTKEELDHCDVYVIDPRGVEYLKNAAGDRYNFVTVYISAPEKTAEQRAILRGDDMDVYRKRRVDEDSQFSDFEVRRSWDYHIVNNSTIENAEMQLVQIFKKEFLLNADASNLRAEPCSVSKFATPVNETCGDKVMSATAI